MDIQKQFASFKLLFDWTPVAVYKPVAVYQTYRDKGTVLLGYEVRVEYKYHNPRQVFFTHDEEKLCLISRKKALKNAIGFYEQMSKKIQEKQK
ncbi:MAG: hypothetical protein IKW57_00160 [Alphaproteobacteria bacterium]|nr:hypothetical protein [Alphaproteobacteria bacterium]